MPTTALLFVIAVLCQKGGVGKTMIATNLFICACRDGFRAVVIDLDPQGSSTDWGRTRSQFYRDTNEQAVITCAPDNLGATLRALKASGVDVAILDTAGGMGSDVDAAMEAADLILIPVVPSLADLRASLPTARAAHRRHAPFAFVLNSCPTVHQRIGDAQDLLSKLSVTAGEPLHRRVVYQDAYARGLGVAEMTDVKATREVAALWQWVEDKRDAMRGDI